MRVFLHPRPASPPAAAVSPRTNENGGTRDRCEAHAVPRAAHRVSGTSPSAMARRCWPSGSRAARWRPALAGRSARGPPRPSACPLPVACARRARGARPPTGRSRRSCRRRLRTRRPSGRMRPRSTALAGAGRAAPPRASLRRLHGPRIPALRSSERPRWGTRRGTRDRRSPPCRGSCLLPIRSPSPKRPARRTSRATHPMSPNNPSGHA